MRCGSKKTAQFFTPFHVSELCAKLRFEENLLKKEEVIEIYEPSVGGGGMILAYSKMLKDKGINYHTKLKVIAQDLAYRAVHMAYVQFSLCGIKAKVKQGNSIANNKKENESAIFYTPTWKGLF